MLKNEYLASDEVRNFIAWLAEILIRNRTLGFNHSGNGTQIWSCVDEVLRQYTWPPKTNNGPSFDQHGLNFPESACFTLPARSSLDVNDRVLTRLQNGLRQSMANEREDVAPWIAAILVWGGVYTCRGNRGWLERNADSVRSIIETTQTALLKNNDDLRQLEVVDLRFNSGLTKVYALLMDDFAIYDSRVAAALAWLVWTWRDCRAIPPLLAFRCMRPNEGQDAVDRKIRNPDGNKFRYLNNNHHEHAKWNLRTNWILQEVRKEHSEMLAGRRGREYTTRDLEAAFFTMGYDLKHALQ